MLVAAVGVALALPARAFAVDHAVLIISPTRLAAHPAWTVHARIVDAAYAGQETFGVSLTRSFLKGRAEEQHEFAPASERTFTFDGQRGRWEAALGVVGGRSNAVTVKMDITATGAPQTVGGVSGLSGGLVQVPVALQGTFALRTGTRFFKTIRRSSFTGVVIFNPGGQVDCTPLASTECSPKSRSLSFSQVLARSSSGQVLMGTGSGRVDEPRLRRPPHFGLALVSRDEDQPVRPALRSATHDKHPHTDQTPDPRRRHVRRPLHVDGNEWRLPNDLGNRLVQGHVQRASPVGAMQTPSSSANGATYREDR